MRDHRHGTVATADFVAHAAGYGGDEIVELLAAWLDAAALPELPGRH